MALKVQFYDSGSCDKCMETPHIHIELTSKYAHERVRLSLCNKCWERVHKKVEINRISEGLLETSKS